MNTKEKTNEIKTGEGKKMKLTYWVAESLNDSEVYNVREKTKKAAVAEVEASDRTFGTEDFGTAHADYGRVRKVTVEYADAFDMMEQCLVEGGGGWEVDAERTWVADDGTIRDLNNNIVQS